MILSEGKICFNQYLALPLTQRICEKRFSKLTFSKKTITRQCSKKITNTALQLYFIQLQSYNMSTVKANQKNLSAEQRSTLLNTLKTRFEKHTNRHKGIEWANVQAKLEGNPSALWSLQEMDRTGGEPDVVAYDKKAGEFIFYDCSAESPAGRRSLCYDRKALDARKENKPKDNAVDVAMAMGIELLTEEQYRQLQELGAFDTKTSSWVQTPTAIRDLGGAIFCDRRYNTVFVYHNGAESYYAARGFRGSLRV